jgi:hypothetical protein
MPCAPLLRLPATRSLAPSFGRGQGCTSNGATSPVACCTGRSIFDRGTCTTIPLWSANVTPENGVWKYAIAAAIVALLDCGGASRVLAAQSNAADETSNSETTSAPAGPQGDSEVDYEHAQPMPLPSVPGPPPAQKWQEPPVPKGSPGHSEGSPGSEGTGDQNPQVLVPSKSSSQPSSDNPSGSAHDNSKN